MPLAQATATSAGRMDASARPTVAQYSTIAASDTASAANATVPVAAGVGRRTERQRDGNQGRGEPRVEAKELHARLARDEDEREDDAEAEMGEEEEKDHGIAG